MGAPRAKAHWHSPDAFGSRLPFELADLAGFRDPREGSAESRSLLASIPTCDRSTGRYADCFDRTSRWNSERRKQLVENCVLESALAVAVVSDNLAAAS